MAAAPGPVTAGSVEATDFDGRSIRLGGGGSGGGTFEDLAVDGDGMSPEPAEGEGAAATAAGAGAPEEGSAKARNIPDAEA